MIRSAGCARLEAEAARNTRLGAIDMPRERAPGHDPRLQMAHCPELGQQMLRQSHQGSVLNGGRYWDRTSGPLPCECNKGSA